MTPRDRIVSRLRNVQMILNALSVPLLTRTENDMQTIGAQLKVTCEEVEDLCREIKVSLTSDPPPP